MFDLNFSELHEENSKAFLQLSLLFVFLQTNTKEFGFEQ